MSRNILFLHDVFPSGGVERMTLDLAAYLSLHGYASFVLTRHCQKEIMPATGSSITVIHLPDSDDTDTLNNADFIIHSINSLSIDVFVLPVQILRHLEYVMSRASCKLVFSLHSVPLWEVKATIEQKRRKSSVSFLKRIEWSLLRYPKMLLTKPYDRLFISKHRFVYELADAYTVLCDGYRDTLIKKLGLPSTENKIRVIANSEPEVGEVNLQKKKQLLYVGRMSYEDKRIDRLIDIWRMIYRKAPDWELVLVGDGAEKERLQAYASSLRVERIRFAGHSTHVKHFYDEASILCLTSTFEGWPLCLTEAQANGVVPIAFNCSEGVSEILSPDGVNGLLNALFSKARYATRLLKLMRNPEQLSRMRQNVLVKSKQYAPDKIGAKWLDLFEGLWREEK